ncbi:MAG: DUF4405 domain-containing protein [Sumerlaeia bacterium]
MKRPTLNYTLDWLLITTFAALAATGVLLHYTLPPGSRAATVFGMSRHQWGDLHWWLAVALFTGVAIHLLLHSAWIKALTLGKSEGRRRRLRLAGAVGGLAVACGVIAAAFFLPVERRADARESSHGESSERADEHEAGEGPAPQGQRLHRRRASQSE